MGHGVAVDTHIDTDLVADADTDAVSPVDTDLADDTDVVSLPYTPGEPRASAMGELRFVPGGMFTMGSPSEEVGRQDDEVAHRVLLTRGFWMQATEVTQEAFLHLVGALPPGNACPSCAVHGVDWYEALAVANLASDAEGLAPCYAMDGCAGDLGAGLRCDSVTTNTELPVDCDGYRLPTEAEWEYAARSAGRVVDAFPAGGSLRPGDENHCDVDVSLTSGVMLGGQAWYCKNLRDPAASVALLTPNQLGLYDMAGNVWELVWDGYADYPTGLVVDPVTEPSNGTSVMRGGAREVPKVERMAIRVRIPSWNAHSEVGFRLVRTARQPAGR